MLVLQTEWLVMEPETYNLIIKLYSHRCTLKHYKQYKLQAKLTITSY